MPAFLRLRVLLYGAAALILAKMFDSSLRSGDLTVSEFERQTRQHMISNIAISIFVFKWLVEEIFVPLFLFSSQYFECYKWFGCPLSIESCRFEQYSGAALVPWEECSNEQCD